MGHRHVFNSSQIVDTDNDQGWNHDEQAYMHLARGGGIPEGNTVVYPAENTVIDGGSFASQQNPAPWAVGQSSSGPNVEIPQYRPQAPGPSHDPFLHLSAAGIHMVQENFAHHASLSNHGGQTFHEVDGGGVDFPVGNVRGPYKRKSPGDSTVGDRGSVSRYYDAGSSSGIPMPNLNPNPWQEKQILDSQETAWDVAPSYRGHGLTTCEDTQRNVRSRTTLDMDANLVWTHLPINQSNNAIPSFSTDHSSSRDVWAQGSSASTREWNYSLMNPTTHARNLVSENNTYGHEINQFNVVNNNPGTAFEVGGYQNDYTLNRIPVSQNLQGSLNQSVRGVRSGYPQRGAPTFRASSSNLRPGDGAPSDERLQAVAESYSSRHSRQIPRDRHGRSRISNDRYRSLPEEAVLRDRFPPEGLMIVDRSAMYASRGLFDQHREMRLDIDNMSYEELLALGERIGSVNTGLSDDLIRKCLTESIFCSSDQSQEEGRCVICLEEYKNMDDVGSLKVCGHDFHVGCVRKWLSMKNLCPICKSAALDDKMKQQN